LGSGVACRILDDLSPEFLDSSHEIWLKALAYLVLNPAERAEWESMKAVSKRRQEWLLGRCAAKDAVREVVAKATGQVLAATDIEIAYDTHGKPEARGAWIGRLRVQPSISITHSHGIAAALATLEPGSHPGIDIETQREAKHFESIAFRDDEREMLGRKVAADRHDEWAIRLWTAKEAVSKALGQGFHQGLHSLHITDFDGAAGTVDLKLSNELAALFPHFAGKKLIAHTGLRGSLAFTTALLRE
jgi:phosphopantetheinyl transferase